MNKARQFWTLRKKLYVSLSILDLMDMSVIVLHCPTLTDIRKKFKPGAGQIQTFEDDF